MSKGLGPKILCPKCGTQYLPGEIYLPKQFLGQPKRVIRDYAGKILEVIGTTMDSKEMYECDKCNCKFSVRAQIQFYTESIDDCKKPFTMKISGNKDKLVLSEK